MKKIIKKEKRKKTSEEKRATKRRTTKGFEHFCTAEAFRTKPTYRPHTSNHAVCGSPITTVFKKKYAETCVKVL